MQCLKKRAICSSTFIYPLQYTFYLHTGEKSRGVILKALTIRPLRPQTCTYPCALIREVLEVSQACSLGYQRKDAEFQHVAEGAR